MSEGTRRLTIGGSLLASVFAALALVTLSGLSGASGTAIAPSETLQLSLYNSADRNVRVRAENAQGQQLVNEAVEPGQQVPFVLARADCLLPIQAWIDGRHYPRVEGNLCPENYPDEAKTLVVMPTGELRALGESRD